METKEYVLPESGEVVNARSRTEAIRKLSRFNYTPDQLSTVMSLEEYNRESHRCQHNGKYRE